jgi:hypothetical protein
MVEDFEPELTPQRDYQAEFLNQRHTMPVQMFDR